jgi:hypothetical protein
LVEYLHIPKLAEYLAELLSGLAEYLAEIFSICLRLSAVANLLRARILFCKNVKLAHLAVTLPENC